MAILDENAIQYVGIPRMKKISAHVENLKMLKEAINSSCNSIRFGAEFCMWKMPTLDLLRETYAVVEKAKKDFKYVTPRLSDGALSKVREHLDFLESRGENEVVINDLGMLNVLLAYKNLKPRLGRQLIFIPARCPWPELPGWDAGYFEKRWVKKLFYQTSLNFEESIRFYKNYHAYGTDLDFIPECFPHYEFLVKHGLSLSVHLFLAPTAITRRCHVARFLGEEIPENCSKPCDEKAFLIKHDVIGVEMTLGGNVVYKNLQPSKREIEKLKIADELIITMSPATEIKNKEKFDEIINNLGLTYS